MEKQKRKNENIPEPPSALFHMLSWGLVSSIIVWSLIAIPSLGEIGHRFLESPIGGYYWRDAWQPDVQLLIASFVVLVIFGLSVGAMNASTMKNYRQNKLEQIISDVMSKQSSSAEKAIYSTFRTTVYMTIWVHFGLTWIVLIILTFHLLPIFVALILWSIFSAFSVFTFGRLLKHGAKRYTKRLENWQAKYYPQMKPKNQPAEDVAIPHTNKRYQKVQIFLHQINTFNIQK